VVLQEGQRVSFELKSEESGRCVCVRGGGAGGGDLVSGGV